MTGIGFKKVWVIYTAAGVLPSAVDIRNNQKLKGHSKLGWLFRFRGLHQETESILATHNRINLLRRYRP